MSPETEQLFPRGRVNFQESVIGEKQRVFPCSTCLVAIDFAFSFKSKSACRYNYTKIEVEFKRALDPTDHKERSDDAAQDPKVVDLAPTSVYGITQTVDEKKYLDISVPLLFQYPVGVSAGIRETEGLNEQSTMKPEWKCTARSTLTMITTMLRMQYLGSLQKTQLKKMESSDNFEPPLCF